MSSPARLGPLLGVTFLGSVSGGAFWTGLFFVTARAYQFSALRNLALAALMGGTYAAAAFSAGGLIRRWERRLSARTVLALSLAIQVLAALAPVARPGHEPTVWLAALVAVASAAITWPIVESYLSAGRHGAELRRALARFNIIWTPAVAVPLLLMTPLIQLTGQVTSMLVLAALGSAGALPLLLALPPRPAAPDVDLSRGSVGREYPQLLRSASILLPLSYVLSSTLSPVLPHRLAAIGVPADQAGLAGATWMVARFVTLLVMGRLTIWHGRWGTLFLGAAALAGGLAAVLLAATPLALIVGLALFGAGMAIIYYAAIYYAMAVGHAAVDAGGSFEALIGLGYLAGPLIGAAGRLVGGEGRHAPVTVALTWLVVALTAYPAVRPYVQVRQTRQDP